MLRTEIELVEKLADEIAAEAVSVRQIEPGSDEFRHYWRGYAQALEKTAHLLMSRAAVATGQ